jgi:hypothetical protein
MNHVRPANQRARIANQSRKRNSGNTVHGNGIGGDRNRNCLENDRYGSGHEQMATPEVLYAAAAVVLALVSPAAAQLQLGPNISPNGIPFTFLPR